ncbi:transmembrane protein 185-like [Sycon ciliatum]|uniref:transmembrane protein 185-like n=1 Tax=Sycon ciliatum TaxID=27933 RepID=UPI0020AD7CA2|eukprot:scpid82574/ scgid10548/ Putative transmembrane protein 185B; Protein FAM11B
MDSQGRFDVRQVFQDCNPSKFVIYACLLLQSIVLSIRLDNTITASYWLVLIPLWVWKAIAFTGAAVGYAVFRRHPESRYDEDARKDILAMFISTGLHVLILLFEIMMCLRLEGLDIAWRLVFIPLFLLCVSSLLSCIFSFRAKRNFEVEILFLVNTLLLIFIALRLDNVIVWQWNTVFIPFWLFLVVYFLIAIYHLVCSVSVLKRVTVVEPDAYCSTSVHGFVSMLVFIPLLTFSVLLVRKLDGEIGPSFAALFVPLHIALLALCISALYKRGSNQWWFGLRMDCYSFVLAHSSALQEYGNITYRKSAPNEFPDREVVVLASGSHAALPSDAPAAATTKKDPCRQTSDIEMLDIRLPD